MTALYEITGELLEMKQMLDDGELSYDELKDQLEASGLEWEAKAENVLKMRQSYLLFAESCKAEIDRIKSAMDSAKNKADWLTGYMRNSMEALGRDKATCGTFQVTLQKASPVLVVDDESTIPTDYFEYIPATQKLDKRALLADAKRGEITGCHLEDGKRGLLVK